jgi:hypothetical protein
MEIGIPFKSFSLHKRQQKNQHKNRPRHENEKCGTIKPISVEIQIIKENELQEENKFGVEF